MGDTGEIGGAAIYAASNIFSWGQALAVPALQAAANIKILDKQDEKFENKIQSARQQIDIAVNSYVNAVESLLPDYRDAFPDIPAAAEYVPIDPAWLTENTIQNNFYALSENNDYVQAANRLHEQNDMIRAVAMDPRYLISADIESITIQDLLRGRLPIGDIVEITTDCAEKAALNGRIGNTGKILHRDLGLSRLRAQAFGRDEFRRMMSSRNQDISPLSRQVSLMAMATSPAENIALALTQAQLIQNSLQNKNNTLAQKDPYLLAQLQTRLERLVFKLQFEASKGSMMNTSVPNYAAILKPQIDAVFDKIGTAVGSGLPSAASNNFFGPPPNQSGSYVASNPSSKSAATHLASDRPSGYF